MTKSLKCNNISRFYATFVKVSRRFMNRNIANVQQRMNLLSNRVAWGDQRSFVQKECHTDPENRKKFVTFYNVFMD